MSADAEDPLLAAAARICDGMPVDWRSVRELLANPALETIAHELESIEHFARASSEAPSAWGRFSIVEELGRGVFGTVYRAVDSSLQIEVALKIIRPRPGVPFDYERALQEARRLARVSHPGVVRVFAVERIGDEVGLSMELVEGRTLDAIVRDQGRFSASEASLIGMDLCRALAAVHGAGLLHGDIKAHNVMRASGGRTMLMDFGAGRELSTEPVAPGSDFAGTPIYLAPEVFAGASRTPVIRHLQPRRAALFPGEPGRTRRGGNPERNRPSARSARSAPAAAGRSSGSAGRLHSRRRARAG